MAALPADSYSGLKVSAERISTLSDTDLSNLFALLIRAHAYKTNVPSSGAYVNAEDKAKDDGCDAWTEPAANPDEWLGREPTCWQLKAGVAGRPARLVGEVSKRIPRETLAKDGRMIVVASGSTNGKKGEDDRLDVLKEEAKSIQLPIDKIQVFGSERIAEWCNEHPSIAWHLAGNTASVVNLDRWEHSEQHQVSWQATDGTQEMLQQARGDVDINAGAIVHVHIQGPPGVGKTRFALELCRDADWSGDVVYVRQAAEVDVGTIVRTVVDNPRSRLVVVVDEVQSQNLTALRDVVGYADGRVRLITIGHSGTPDPDRIPSIRIDPLDDAQMAALVRAWHPGMPKEHVDFVVRFADGYVRLGQLAARAVARNPHGSVRDLLDQEHIRGFLDAMLGGVDRRALYVVAALSTVGWIEDLAHEGEAISAHFGLDWLAVQTSIEQFDRRFGIAPRGGRRRYISPTPLAAHLAVEAWAAMPDAMRSLPGALPTEEARNAYYERIKTIATTPFARDFAVSDLQGFFELAAFQKEMDVKRWAALSAAAPLIAANGVLKVLIAASVEDRKNISGLPRRHLVSGLMDLASSAKTFREAALSIALLAEAENEIYTNNATGEFCSFFQVHLGGTAAPYFKRIQVAEELIRFDRDAITSLVIRALGKAADIHESRFREPVAFGMPSEAEWRPHNSEERFECIKAAIRLLSSLSGNSGALARTAMQAVIPQVVQVLWINELRPVALDFIKRVSVAAPETRKIAIKAVSSYLLNEKKYWNRLSEEAETAITSELERLTPSDLQSRLEQAVGTSPWDRPSDFDFKPLAREILTEKRLTKSIPWLTSGEATDAWRFGEVVSQVGDLNSLVAFFDGDVCLGPDLRFVLSIVSEAKNKFGESWYENWLRGKIQDDKFHADLVLESIWRIGAAETSLNAVERLVPYASRSSINGLAFGNWYLSVDVAALRAFLRRLHNLGELQVALQIVDQVTKEHPDFGSELAGLVGDLLASSSLLMTKEVMSEYHWKELALRFLDSHDAIVLETILEAHADRSERAWFADYSQAKEVLQVIARNNPELFWEKVRRYLENSQQRGLFAIGFPQGLFQSVPFEELRSWVAVDPKDRAGLIARLVGADFHEDESISVKLINEFGGDSRIDDAFFSTYASGSWWGAASMHWYSLADALTKESERRTGYFQTWAKNAAESLRAMGDRDKGREEEEEAIQKNR